MLSYVHCANDGFTSNNVITIHTWIGMRGYQPNWLIRL